VPRAGQPLGHVHRQAEGGRQDLRALQDAESRRGVQHAERRDLLVLGAQPVGQGLDLLAAQVGEARARLVPADQAGDVGVRLPVPAEDHLGVHGHRSFARRRPGGPVIIWLVGITRT
jgi:hypothetical protein